MFTRTKSMDQIDSFYCSLLNHILKMHSFLLYLFSVWQKSIFFFSLDLSFLSISAESSFIVICTLPLTPLPPVYPQFNTN